MTDPVDLAYLNGMYEGKDDPWGIGTGWYETRKRDLVLASLPRPHYGSAFEPGCSIGDLTVQLAQRCDRVLAADLNATAVATTADRVSPYPHVQVAQLLLPGDWPSGRFDLIVLSEIAYFFTVDAWAQLCDSAAASLATGATVLACHWRHDFEQRTMPSQAAHDRLAQALGGPPQISLLDPDFLLDVWSLDPRSPAQQQGLAR